MVEVLEHTAQSFTWKTESSYFMSTRQSLGQSHLYECVLGDPAEAAIFRRSDELVSGSEDIDPEILTKILEAGWIDRDLLAQHIDDLGKKPLSGACSTYTRTLRALAAAATAYKLMPSATIVASIFSRPLHDARWIPRKGKKDRETAQHEPAIVAPSSLVFGSTIDPRLIYKPEINTEETSPSENDVQGISSELTTYTLSREQTFACIAMFENRNVNLDPGSLQQVMALSTGNSIYIAMPLACDPFECPLGYEMKRIVGNIGRPGISLMIPPTAPKVRKVDETSWSHTPHARFDGRFEDSFQRTSMHLSFTRYKLPVSLNSHGDQAVEANFVETLVSVYDREDWVADLNVLGALQAPCLKRLDRSGETKCRHKVRSRSPFALTSIDSWHEYLDRPIDPAIFRANNNWHARLSVTALHAMRGQKTVLFRDEKAICWPCIANTYKDSNDISLCVHDTGGDVPLFIC